MNTQAELPTTKIIKVIFRKVTAHGFSLFPKKFKDKESIEPYRILKGLTIVRTELMDAPVIKEMTASESQERKDVMAFYSRNHTSLMRSKMCD